MTVNQEFGKRIRELREAKKKHDSNYSLRKFAFAIDVSPTFLSKVETGEFHPPSPPKIIKMAELLDVNADELLALAGKVDPELFEIIMQQPKEMSDFLRAVSESKLSADDLKALTKIIAKK